MGVFQKEILVDNKYIDVEAGIVSYPIYMQLIYGVVEDWFQKITGRSLEEIYQKESTIIMVEESHCHFSKPSCLGEKLNIQLIVSHLDQYSIGFQISALCDNEMRLNANITVRHVMLNNSVIVDKNISEKVATRIREYKNSSRSAC